MHFNMKNYLKNTRNHTVKHALKSKTTVVKSSCALEGQVKRMKHFSHHNNKKKTKCLPWNQRKEKPPSPCKLVGPARHYPGGALPMSLLTSANDGTMCPAAPLWRQARHGTRIPCQEAKCERRNCHVSKNLLESLPNPRVLIPLINIEII